MTDDHIQKLTDMFSKFPGVGPRQARRFVYHLINTDTGYLGNLSKTIQELRSHVVQCNDCRRFYIPKHNTEKNGKCAICLDSNKDTATLLIIEKDADLENIERTGMYTGHYFVLGGLVPVLEKEPKKRVRQKELEALLGRRDGLKELVLALSAHVDGDHTVEYLKKALSPILKEKSITLTVLGRGLSTGTELEYSDADTLKNALKNRG